MSGGLNCVNGDVCEWWIELNEWEHVCEWWIELCEWEHVETEKRREGWEGSGG